MSIWSRVRAAISPQNSSLASPEQWLIDAFLGGLTAKSGVHVTELTALGVPTVYSCVSVISDTLATLPVSLYRRSPSGTKERLSDHPASRLLNGRPNPEMTSLDLIGSIAWQLTLRQKAFAYVNRDGGARPAELWPIEPRRVDWQRDGNGALEYYLDEERVKAADLLHFKGVTMNGLNTVDPLQTGRDSIGLAIALGDNASMFFKNGSKLGNVYSAEGSMNDEQVKRLKAQLKERRAKGQDFSDLFLEEGMKLIETRAQNRDAQFLESRKYQDERIAAIYKVPPHKVGILDRSTNNNIEHQGIEFVQDTILPWARRIETTFNLFLLSDEERAQGLYFEFLLEGLLRGDLQTRYEAYAKGRQWGWLSANDIRKRENMDPIIGGDEYLTPLNMVPASEKPTDNN
jgi:HK97 family phage portal protein